MEENIYIYLYIIYIHVYVPPNVPLVRLINGMPVGSLTYSPQAYTILHLMYDLNKPKYGCRRKHVVSAIIVQPRTVFIVSPINTFELFLSISYYAYSCIEGLGFQSGHRDLHILHTKMLHSYIPLR